MDVASSLSNVGGVATHAALSVWSVANGFLIVIILFVFFFFLARYLGRGPFMALLLSFYSAYGVYAVFPTKVLPSAPPVTAIVSHAALYVALVILFFIILRRIVVSDFLYIGVFGLIILSLLCAAFILTLSYQVFAIQETYHFTPVLTLLFSSPRTFFWWFIGPAVGLFVFAR